MEALPVELTDEVDFGMDEEDELEGTQDIEFPEEGDQAYDSGLDETPFNYNEQPGYEYGVSFDFGDEYADARRNGRCHGIDGDAHALARGHGLLRHQRAANQQ